MSNKITDMDLLLESAIREKGLKGRMAMIERREKTRRRYISSFSYAFAACLTVLLCLTGKQAYDVSVAGYAFDPVMGQMGGSEITALMAGKKISEARAMIAQSRQSLENELQNTTSSDEDYILQLQNDVQELEFLDAVCLMRQGRFITAKRALKSIVSAQGAFAEDAAVLLEECK